MRAVNAARVPLLVLVLVYLQLVVPNSAQAGELVETSFVSPILGRAWSFSVYLPDGYRAAPRRYPLILFLPGLSTRRNEWAELTLPRLVDAAVAAGTMPPAIIVVPELAASWGVDAREPMETALINDLLPEIDRRYRTLAGRTGHLIAGISAGGFAALRLALLYPDRFAAAALLSPAIYVPEPPVESGARRGTVFGEPDFDPAIWQARNYPALLPGFLARGIHMPLFIGSGATDRLGIAAQATKLHEVWKANGQPAKLRIIDGDHSYTVWKALLDDALTFLLNHAGSPDDHANVAQQ